MCGICGIYLDDPNGRVDADRLRAMTDSLIHRGPDGQGAHIDRQIGLGHRRLSIIDLEAGDQPIYNEDRTVVIVFNGEIYNYRELRESLKDRGHVLATESDTEVIVHLYEELGNDCVQPLNGMFAFALWDARKQRLLIARDRLGEKPLYYTHVGGRLIFASELKGVLEHGGIPRTISPEALDDYLAYGYIPAPRTIFKDIHKLEPGHTMVWESGTIRTQRYWDISFEQEDRLDEHEHIERLLASLRDSVRLRLRSDVPLGSFLSGGIDSSAIVALASLESSKPIETFSVGFSSSDFDEIKYARIVAKQYNTNHHETVIEDFDASLFPELVRHFDEPFADDSAIPTYYLTREARRFVTVCLSGDGGDEVFGGYNQYTQCLREPWVDWIPEPLRRAAFGGLSRFVPDHVPGKGWFRRMSTSGAVRYQRQLGIFDSVERQALFLPEMRRFIDTKAWLFKDFFTLNGHDAIATRLHTDQMTYLPEDILVKVDRDSMRHSLEVRVPFLDHNVVACANAMPSDMKVRAGATKILFKKALATLLPEGILNRPKRGFGLPIKHWLRGDLYDYAQDRLLAPDSRSARFFHRKAMGRLIDAHRKGPRNLSARVWALLWFEQWCREFGV